MGHNLDNFICSDVSFSGPWTATISSVVHQHNKEFEFRNKGKSISGKVIKFLQSNTVSITTRILYKQK